MAQYCDDFKFSENNQDHFVMGPVSNDTFQFWQGLRGPYFTPSVDEDGVLSWTNNGQLPNPEPVRIVGKDGRGITLTGQCETVAELPEDPDQGEAWAVGEEEPFECYAWFGEWVDMGLLFPAGQDGVSPAVTITQTSTGHKVKITDKTHPAGQEFDVDNGTPGAPGEDGVSPAVTITPTSTGHKVKITDKTHPAGQEFDVDNGTPGAPGQGVPAGGAAGQFLRKTSAADYDAEWYSPAAGDVSFDSSLTYPTGTVGAEIISQRNTLNHKADVIYDTASGDIASFPDGADGLPVKDLTVAIEPVQSGTGDPSPTNVRPISGWTGCNVTRTGKNLFNTVLEQGAFDAHGADGSNPNYVRCKGFIEVGPLTETVLTVNYLSSNVRIAIAAYTSNNPATNTKVFDSSWQNNGYSFTFPASAKYFRIIFTKDYTSAIVPSEVSDIQIEFGTSATAYEPYSGTTFPISWQSSAGTVYGGTLDVTSGVLTVTWAGAEFDGSADENWEKKSASRAYMAIWIPYSIKYSSTTAMPPIVSNIALPIPQDATYSAYTDSRVGTSVGDRNLLRYLFAGVTDTMTVEAFKAWLQANPLQVVYKLATPQTYQLTPTEVTTLLGQNNIWSDTGSSTVEYPADTKLYVDNGIGEVENTLNQLALIGNTTAINQNGTYTKENVTGMTANHKVANWGLFSDANLTTPISPNNPPADITIAEEAGGYVITIANYTSAFYMKPTFILPQN